VRENYGLENVYAFFTTDGEQRQIQTFMEEKSIDLLEEYKIIYGKHSASYSAKGNAFDAGNYFKATKMRTKHMLKQEVEEETYHLRRRLDNYVTNEISHMTKSKRDHIVDSCCRVTASCQKTCNINIIKHGFQKTGQYVNSGFNFDVKMSCCKSDISKDHLTNMRNKLEELTLVFRQQGFITEHQLDTARIISVEETRLKPKDERVPHQQRAMVLNTEENLVRLNNYRVPEILAPDNRETFQEKASQRKKREKRESDEAAAKARSEMKTLQVLERERVKIFNKEKKQRERREKA